MEEKACREDQQFSVSNKTRLLSPDNRILKGVMPSTIAVHVPNLTWTCWAVMTFDTQRKGDKK